MLTVRMDDRELARLERARDPDVYPTQSAFVREAVRRMVREERRRRIEAEAKRLAADPGEVARARELAAAGVEDWLATLDGDEPGGA